MARVLAVQEPVTFQEHQIAREAREFIAGFATASWVKAMNYEHHVAPPTSALFEKYACVLQEHGGQLSSALSTSADGRDSARPGRAGRYMQLWCQRLRKTWGLRLGKLAGSAFLPVEEARAKAVSIFYQWVDFLHRQARVQDVQIEWVNLDETSIPQRFHDSRGNLAALPKVWIGNRHLFPAQALAAVSGEVPPNVYLWRETSSWNTSKLMEEILLLIADSAGR
ncbi:unnamed protein product, partial [Effrenium voratum]